ncbi:MAG: BatA domain-containing protein [Phycisphaerales bacterium]|nr:BatA domain-containing protein [Phycisphaerales bacterium]
MFLLVSLSAMILAAISFSDPVMLAGLAAAGIPVVLHLLNRIRSPIVAFPTLRFLKITAQKTSRRRQVQQYLLLLVRMAVFAMIAMAISRPLIRGGNAALAYGFVVMFLAAMTMLVMAGVWGAAAVEKRQEDKVTRGQGDRVTGKQEQRQYWGLSAGAMGAAILLAGYSTFGLASDRYFSGDRGEFTGRATAAVMVIDNSQSMLAREDGASRLQRAKEQVRQMLGEKIVPAEAAVLPTNPEMGGGGGGGQTATDGLTSDITRLFGSVEKLGSTGKARPMQDRIRTAATMLGNSRQPGKLLIVVSDFARPAFEDAAVFSGIREAGNGNGVKDLQVVLMPMGKGSPPADVGIASFIVAEGGGGGHPVVGSEILFEAQIINNGDAGEVKDLLFEVDDQPVESVRPRVTLGAGGTGAARATIKIAYRLTQPGAHRFTLRLADTQDAVDWNNQRQLVLNVADQMRVLVIGPEAKIRARSAAFYVDAALSPFGGTGGTPVPRWSIKPTYRGVDEIKDGALAGYSAVFVCDVPQISEALAEGLSKYVKAGGRVVWVLGPSVNAAVYNDVLGKERELLPGTLGEPLSSAMGSTVDWVDIKSDVFVNLFENQEPFRSVVVTGRWSLNGGVVRGRPLGKLADGNVFITQHSQTGESDGEVYTLLTSPSATWSNLGATVLMVPLVSRMAMGDSGKARGETSVVTGEGLHIPVTGSRGRAEGDRNLGGMTIDVKTPTEGVINVRPQKLGDIPAWWFDRTQTEGVYTWRGSDGKHTGMFVVNPPGEEVELQPCDLDALAREVGTNRPTIIAGNASELLGHLEKQSEGTTLAPGVLAMVLMLAVIEALMANRHRPATRNMDDPGKMDVPVFPGKSPDS